MKRVLGKTYLSVTLLRKIFVALRDYLTKNDRINLTGNSTENLHQFHFLQLIIDKDFIRASI